MKIALVSTGLGRVLRGFESFTESLFQALQRDAPGIDVTLFQGGGMPRAQRVVVPNFHRADLPARWFGPSAASHWEKRSFALALYFWSGLNDYDVVHYNELTMGSALFHLRRMFGGKFKLLYCNGAPSPAIHYHHRCDIAQLLTEPDYGEAVAFGLNKNRIVQVPYGVDGEVFHPRQKQHRAAVRGDLGIPADAHVVLSVAAVKRDHKRIDFLIEEVAKLGEDAWLVVAGQPTEDTPFLEAFAERLMPGRWRFVSWPHERVAQLYGAADVFALCSLTEAFGLVSVEAMLSELPVALHHGPVFRWLTRGTSARLIDMERSGALTAALKDILLAKGSVAGQGRLLQQTRDAAFQRFSWQEILPQYVDVYRAALGH